VGLIALPVCGRRREQPTDTKRQWAARVVAMASRRYGEPLAGHIARDAEKGLIRTTADMRRRYALRPAVVEVDLLLDEIEQRASTSSS
jgi:hypothetical protein